MRAITYARVSRRNARGGASYLSPVQQEEQTAHYVAGRGGVVVEHLFDEDRSGGTLEREGLERALQAIEAGEADTLIVAKLDRLARSIAGAHAVIARVDAAGGRFVSVADSFDLATPTGRLTFNILASFAEFELDRLRSGWNDVHARNVAAGVATRHPWGYERGRGRRLVPTADGRRFVAETFRRRAAGATYGEIARWLTAEGARTQSGGEWTDAGVRHLIANRAFLGEVSYGELVNRNAHDELVDEPTWLAAQRPRGTAVRNGNGLLTGLARCAACRRALEYSGATPSRPWAVYRHPGGPCAQTVQVKAEEIETHVTGWARNELAAVALERSGPAADTDALEQLDRLRDVRDEIARDTDALMRLGVGAHSAQVAELDARIHAIEVELGRGVEPDATLPSPEALDALDHADLRAVLAAMAGAVFVRGLPGRGRKAPIGWRTAIVDRPLEAGELPVRGRTVDLLPWPFDD